jgi:hypothetical protein
VSHHSSRAHRALTKFRHQTRFLASALASFHVLPWGLISSNSCPCFRVNSRRHDVRPFLLCAGFSNRLV